MLPRPAPWLLGAITLVAGLSGCLGAEEEASGDTTEWALELPPGTVLHRAGGTNETVTNLSVLSRPLIELLASARGGASYSGLGALEPTVGIAPDGGIFLAQLSAYEVVPGVGETSGPRRATHIARSLDQGASWDDVTPRLPSGHPDPPQTNDPFLHVDPITGRVLSLDLEGTICDYLQYSDDGGETWNRNPVACGLPPGGHDHQSITTAPPRTLTTDGYANVLYYCVNRPGIDSACATSLDGGESWGTMVSAFSASNGGCGGLHGHVAAAPDGTVYLPKGDCGGAAKVSVTTDDGQTWTPKVVHDEAGADHELRVAVDETGNVYAFWQGRDGLPYLAVSRDQGDSWTEPLMVGPPGLTGMDFPAIAAGAQGRIAFAYVGTDHPDPYGTDNPNPVPQVQEARDIPGMSWHPYIGIIVDALQPDPLIVTTVAAEDPLDPIVRDECGRIRCPGIGDFIDIDIDPEGRPWAAFVDVCLAACSGPDGEDNAGGIHGFAGTLVAGPALRGELAPLDEVPFQTAGPSGGAGDGTRHALLRANPYR